MKKQILFVLVFLCLQSNAIETDKAAHFGLSYTINTISYGFWNSFFKDRPAALAFSIVTTGLIGYMKEFSDDKIDNRDLLADGLGIITSVGTIIIFDF